MKHPFIKKFIIIYLSAVVLVLLYFIIKTLFLEDKEIELKSFNEKKESVIQEDLPSKKKSEQRFLLLPSK